MAMNAKEQLTSAFADFADVVQQNKYPAPYFTAMDAIDMDFPYFAGIPARIALFSRLVDHDGFRQILPLHNVAASPLSVEDLGPFLRKAYSMSFVDEIVGLAQVGYVGTSWPGIASILKGMINPRISEKLAELAAVTFDCAPLFADVSPQSADLAFSGGHPLSSSIPSLVDTASMWIWSSPRGFWQKRASRTSIWSTTVTSSLSHAAARFARAIGSRSSVVLAGIKVIGGKPMP